MNPLVSKNQQQPNIAEVYGQFKQDPLSFLAKTKLNIPANVTEPQQIVQHLLNSGQISQQQLQQAQGMAQRLFGR